MVIETARDVAAEFEQIYANYARRVTWMFVNWGQDWATAQDLTGELFTRLWEEMAGGRLKLEEIERLSGFLRLRARWTLSRYFQARRAEFSLDDGPVPADQDAALADTAPGPETTVPMRLHVRQTLAKLPSAQRHLVALRYLNDLPPQEVAAQTGLAENTVHQRLREALNTLREAEGVPVRSLQEARRDVAADKQEAAELYHASLDAGTAMTMAALGARFGRSERWALRVVQESGLHRPCPNAEGQAREILRAQIAAGEWAPGEQLPPPVQLAPRLGVQRSKVSRVLGALAAEGLIERRGADGRGTAYLVLRPHAAPVSAPSVPDADSVRARVSAHLTAAVADGTYPPGALLPDGGELARRYQVSSGYMVRVLRELVERGTLTRAGARFVAPGGQPLATGHTRARLAEALRGDLAAGLYPPGAPLPAARELARRYATSESTTRDALRALAAAGLAEKHDGRYYAAQPAGLATVTALRPALVTNTYLVTGRVPTGRNTFPTAQVAA